MPSRECPVCANRYPSVVAKTHCPRCKEVLEYNASEPSNVSKTEYDELCYIAGTKLPKELTEKELEEWESDWAALEAEAERRGSWWSVADLIEQGFRPVA